MWQKVVTMEAQLSRRTGRVHTENMFTKTRRSSVLSGIRYTGVFNQDI